MKAVKLILALASVSALAAYDMTESHNSPQADPNGYMQPVYKVDPRFELSEPTNNPQLIT